MNANTDQLLDMLTWNKEAALRLIEMRANPHNTDAELEMIDNTLLALASERELIKSTLGLHTLLERVKSTQAELKMHTA